MISHTNAGVKQAAMSIKVIKADGRVIDYGIVSYQGSNPLKSLWYRFFIPLHRAWVDFRNRV